MNVAAIQAELAARLKPLYEQVYLSPPASPVYPCAIVNFPSIETFHVDHAHMLTRSQWAVTLVAGRGDVDESYSVIAGWLSDGTPTSVRDALEARRTPTPPWSRLSLTSTSPPEVGQESVEVAISIEIDS